MKKEESIDPIASRDENVEETLELSEDKTNPNVKYLSVEQMSFSNYCDDSQIEMTLSLHNVLATNGKLKKLKIYKQNIVECIIGRDNRQYKAVIKINNNPCLLNVIVDPDMGEAELIESASVELQACSAA